MQFEHAVHFQSGQNFDKNECVIDACQENESKVVSLTSTSKQDQKQVLDSPSDSCLFPKHKATRSISAPLDGMLVHHRATPSITIHRYPFINLGGKKHCESKVSRPSERKNELRSFLRIPCPTCGLR